MYLPAFASCSVYGASYVHLPRSLYRHTVVYNSTSSVHLNQRYSSNMSTKYVPDGFQNPVTVTLPQNITEEQLLNFPAFETWKSTLQETLRRQYQEPDLPFYDSPFSLHSITVQSVDWFGPKKIGFVKL